MLDEEVEQLHLAQAEIHLRKAQATIRKQQNVIEQLTREGRDTTDAKATLALFSDTLQTMLTHRDLILETLAAIQRRRQNTG